MIKFGSRSLQHAFKHAADFGVLGNWNNANRDLFRQAILDHIVNPAVTKTGGTYRGNLAVAHYFEPATELWAAVDLNDYFVAAWRLSRRRIVALNSTGNVQ